MSAFKLTFYVDILPRYKIFSFCWEIPRNCQIKLLPPSRETFVTVSLDYLLSNRLQKSLSLIFAVSISKKYVSSPVFLWSKQIEESLLLICKILQEIRIWGIPLTYILTAPAQLTLNWCGITTQSSEQSSQLISEELAKDEQICKICQNCWVNRQQSGCLHRINTHEGKTF